MIDRAGRGSLMGRKAEAAVLCISHGRTRGVLSSYKPCRSTAVSMIASGRSFGEAENVDVLGAGGEDSRWLKE